MALTHKKFYNILERTLKGFDPNEPPPKDSGTKYANFQGYKLFDSISISVGGNLIGEYNSDGFLPYIDMITMVKLTKEDYENTSSIFSQIKIIKQDEFIMLIEQNGIKYWVPLYGQNFIQDSKSKKSKNK